MDERRQPHSGPQPGGEADQPPERQWAEYAEWRDGEMGASQNHDPELWDLDGAVDPDDIWDPDETWDPRVGLRFGQGDEADVLPPGPLLVGLTEEAVRDFGALSNNELIGVLQAARRQQARETYKQVLVMAEFGRRQQAAFESARDRGVPVGCCPGGFPGEELAMELVTSRIQAAHRIENAIDLTTRLPATLAGMAAGLIDEDRASYIAYYTRSLDPADAARADEILAAAAPDLRVDQLARKAAALEMKLAPEAAKARKEHEKRTSQRVEARREHSGNASLSAREMDTVDAMASKAYIDAMAARLRNGGLDAPLGALRVLAMTDLTQGRNPLERLNPATAPGPAAPAPASPAPASFASSAPGTGPYDNSPRYGYDGPDNQLDSDADEAATAPHDDPLADEPGEPSYWRSLRRSEPAPPPALINLLVPAGTLLGWSTAPAQAGTWGLLDHEETRAIVAAASRHPRTRWCVTLTDDKGEAAAHACARGQRPGLLDDLGPQPPPAQLAGLLRRLNLTFEPIARDTCDHAHAEDHYTPSRGLKHMVRARTAICDAPGCDTQAIHADLDHTVPYPAGPTDECNLGPRCRTHHRCKQAPDWNVEQTQPGTTRWTLPSGRVHTTAATVYTL